MRSPINIRTRFDGLACDDVLNEESILWQLLTAIIKPLPAHAHGSLDHNTLSVHSKPCRFPHLKSLTFIERQSDVTLFFFVGDQLMPIVHRATEPITEYAKRPIDLLRVIEKKAARVFGHGLRLSEEAQHFGFWLTPIEAKKAPEVKPWRPSRRSRGVFIPAHADGERRGKRRQVATD